MDGGECAGPDKTVMILTLNNSEESIENFFFGLWV